jgi:hypothetical protein
MEHLKNQLKKEVQTPPYVNENDQMISMTSTTKTQQL